MARRVQRTSSRLLIEQINLHGKTRVYVRKKDRCSPIKFRVTHTQEKWMKWKFCFWSGKTVCPKSQNAPPLMEFEKWTTGNNGPHEEIPLTGYKLHGLRYCQNWKLTIRKNRYCKLKQRGIMIWDQDWLTLIHGVDNYFVKRKRNWNFVHRRNYYTFSTQAAEKCTLSMTNNN